MWESLWVSHHGPRGGGGEAWLGSETSGGALNWRGLGEYVANLQCQACTNGPASSVDTREFDVDANGTPVSWGPATSPLWRPDIFGRCRMLVTKHIDGLHAFAAYRTMTGRRFSSPRGASLGAEVDGATFGDGARLRELCGVYVKSPQSMLAGVVRGERFEAPRLHVCNDEPCDYRAVCETYEPVLARLGYRTVCSVGSVGEPLPLVLGIGARDDGGDFEGLSVKRDAGWPVRAGGILLGGR